MTSDDRLAVQVTVSCAAWPVSTGRIADLLAFAARREGVAGGELSVWICTDAEIATLHERFMGIPGPTDVMSFEGEADYRGDIAVSYDTARAQAIEAGHGTNRELAYLALHGLLHLLGYDDTEPSKRAAMLARQDALMADFERESAGEWR